VAAVGVRHPEGTGIEEDQEAAAGEHHSEEPGPGRQEG